jgi:hypothetical protein
MLRRFPLLYAGLRAEPTNRVEPITREGFAVGRGWWPLVVRLSDQIAAVVERQPAAERPDYRIGQVKEKYGRLTVYEVGGTLPEIEVAIEAAADESERTCELCGRPGGSQKVEGWVGVRCSSCLESESVR